MKFSKVTILLAFVFITAVVGCKKSGGDSGGAPPLPSTVAPLHTDGRWFRDAQGRVVILRGINVSNQVKRDPFDYMVDESDWDNLYDWGMNCVRLLIGWEALEPQKGVYNPAFLEKTNQQVQWAAERGIYVILDMHQDVYGSYFGGNGAPQWATRQDIPFTWNNPWGINYFSKAVMASYDTFWTDPELQAHFAGAWLTAVGRFIDQPNIIGYDLYNEPYFGSRAPWDFERNYLGPFQDYVGATIRSLDPYRIIFYETYGFASGGIATFLPPPAISGNVALAPHFYDPNLGLVHDQPYDGNDGRMRAMMELRNRECLGLGNIPWHLGEFGVASGANADQYVADIYNALDEHMASGTYWVYNKDNYMGPLYPDGSDKPRLNDMVRVVPLAIAGTPYAFSFDSTSKIFTLSIKEETDVQGPTEIFIPEARHYPNGFVVESTGTDWSWDYDGRILKWYSDGSRYTNTLTIKPAP